ncbi:MAG: ABC-three component system protein [Bacteroidales bacterium]
MKYPLHDMNCDDFESMIILICNHILGFGTIPFSKGKDGGKDGKFIGQANKIPSEINPWNGQIIIQAKHTSIINASCSDSSFSKIIDKDVIPAIQKLKNKNEIDFYILFTNRTLTGIKDSVIAEKIKNSTDIPTILMADEKIQLFLKEFPDVVKIANLKRLLLPFEFDESDLREVITFLHNQIKENDIVPLQIGFEYPGLEKKNELNNLSKHYFDEVIKKSMDDFYKIRQFLSTSINQDVEEIYEDAVSELNAKISLRREDFYEFEHILEKCYDNMVNDNPEALKGKKKLVRILLHYMYCNCDLGIKE